MSFYRGGFWQLPSTSRHPGHLLTEAGSSVLEQLVFPSLVPPWTSAEACHPRY